MKLFRTKMREMKVLMIIPDFGFGGAERSFSNLSIELAKVYTVYVVVFNTNISRRYTYGGKIINLDVNAGVGYVGKLVQLFKRVLKIRRIKKALDIDISLSFLEGADYVNLLSKRKDKIIFSIRGSKINDETITGLIGKIRRYILIPFFYKQADFIVALNQGIKKELEDHFRIKNVPIETIYNFYDLLVCDSLANESIPEQYLEIFDETVIISHGRLAKEKGFQHLIKVFSQCQYINHKPRLVLLGDGPFKYELFEQCDKLGLNYFRWDEPSEITPEHKIFFLGYQKNPFKFLRKSTIFTLTSSSEGFGNSLAEALICRVPVLSADCPSGPREVIAPNTLLPADLVNSEYAAYGILLPLLNKPDNNAAVQVWVETITKILNNDALRKHYSLLGNERIRNFDVHSIMSKWHSVIYRASHQNISS